MAEHEKCEEIIESEKRMCAADIQIDIQIKKQHYVVYDFVDILVPFKTHKYDEQRP